MIRRLISAAVLAAWLSTPATAAEIAPHRASYALALAAAAAAMAAAEGDLAVEVSRSCGATTVRQAMRLVLAEVGGDASSSRITSLLTENDEGTRLDFAFSFEVDGEADADIWAGQAFLAGGGGVVQYETPAGRQLELPAGAMFPVAHTRAVLDSAAAGTRFLSTVLFEGGRPDSLSTVAVAVGAAQGGDGAARFDGLTGRRAWALDLAYYGVGDADGEPDYQVGYLLYEGAILDRLDLDYGLFRLKGTLTALELLPSPVCPGD